MSTQPFWDDEHKTAITFNGEIYNYKILRREFAEETYYTNGEAELLLKLYKRYGESFVSKLDGMFAICIIDLLKGVIFAARDKQGIKPLYYYEDSNIFMLASELKAIRAVIPLEINHRAIEMYFSYRFIPAPYTIYNDVFKLKAGEQISFFMHGETTTRHCFQYNYTLPETPFNADDCEKKIRKNIISTFNHGDVPIGLFLSGGIDSGIIASVLKERLRREENALHIEYSGSFEEISEERMLFPLISELGIKCKRVLFDEVILLLDEPSNDLDIDTLIFLESFIRDSAIPIIFISHDEMLISSCANVIIHIEQLIRKTKCSITVSRLTYEDYLKFRNLQFDRQNQIAHKERSEYKKKRERLLQLYEKARHNTGWKNPDGIASSDGHAKKSMQAIVSKGKRFEREKDNFTEIPDRETGIITKFDSNIFVPSQKRIIDIELPELKIDGKVLSANIVLSVIGNQHVCIIGKNGAGKSTLLKTIWHELKGRTDIVVGYMPQDYRDVLDYDSTPVDYLQTTYDKETYTKALTFMGTMKFTRDEMHHKIGELSGGHRAKIIYLGMVLQYANVLVLDEPTRNFSPLSAPVIRTALSEFNGTIISISHDRMYLDEVADG